LASILFTPASLGGGCSDGAYQRRGHDDETEKSGHVQALGEAEG